jgi:lipoprotein-anchoring transpeptidase ErfK/SrfK
MPELKKNMKQCCLRFAYYNMGGDLMAYAITVNLSARRLTLYRDGSPVKSYPVGIGKILTPTPAGTYYIINKAPNPGGPFGVMWMGLNRKGYGIHGTNNPASIGKVVSHGCIRMYNQDVLELSRLVPIGTPVRIFG